MLTTDWMGYTITYSYLPLFTHAFHLHIFHLLALMAQHAGMSGLQYFARLPYCSPIFRSPLKGYIVYRYGSCCMCAHLLTCPSSGHLSAPVLDLSASISVSEPVIFDNLTLIDLISAMPIKRLINLLR